MLEPAKIKEIGCFLICTSRPTVRKDLRTSDLMDTTQHTRINALFCLVQ